MNSIGRICTYVYISSNTRIYSISPEGFIQACVSVTLLQGGSSIFFLLDTPLIYILYIYFFGLTPPTPCEKKMRRMWPTGTRSMPMPSLKNGTPRDKYRGHLGEK